MKEEQKFSFKNRLASFKYAFNGLKILIKEEHNARIHLLITFLVVLAGYYFKLSVIDWCVIILCIGFVFFAELVNSSIENIGDFISPEKHPTIKKIKDLAAAAVLMAVISAIIIGLIIFLPKINMP